MNCKDLCIVCEKAQTTKVNKAKFHGVCEKHELLFPQIVMCIHCSAKVPATNLRTCILCRDLLIKSYSSCEHFICRACSDKNQCPFCKVCEYCLKAGNCLMNQCSTHQICDNCFSNDPNCPLCAIKNDELKSSCYNKNLTIEVNRIEKLEKMVEPTEIKYTNFSEDAKEILTPNEIAYQNFRRDDPNEKTERIFEINKISEESKDKDLNLEHMIQNLKIDKEEASRLENKQYSGEGISDQKNFNLAQNGSKKSLVIFSVACMSIIIIGALYKSPSIRKAILCKFLMNKE